MATDLYIDIPLPLLSTPAFETGKRDPFTMEASHMTLSHNSIIRGYNSIYQQAPRITTPDQDDFIGYCLVWHEFVEKHHHYEEVHFFPAIEKAVGEKGAMDHEIAEHRAFYPGLNSFNKYLEEVQKNKTGFQSSHLLEIMDSFSVPLYSHLVSEPKALVALSRFSTPNENPFDITLIALEQGKKQVSLGFTLNVMPMFLLNMEEVEFENGMWSTFPPVPSAVKWVLKSLVPLWQRRLWRFASCDSRGKRKQLAV